METYRCKRLFLAELLQLIREGTIDKCISTVEQITTTDNNTIDIYFILQKMKRTKSGTNGFSLNEIATIGNQIEYANVTSTAIQNWVKRDIKELIGSPSQGKKYSIDQATILFIVEDLKMVLDFDSIRKMLTLIFNNPADRTDDIIDPVTFYKGYASIFEKLISISELQKMPNEQWIESEAELFLDTTVVLNANEKGIVKNLLVLAVLAVQSSLYKVKSASYLFTTLQKHNNRL